MKSQKKLEKARKSQKKLEKSQKRLEKIRKGYKKLGKARKRLKKLEIARKSQKRLECQKKLYFSPNRRYASLYMLAYYKLLIRPYPPTNFTYPYRIHIRDKLFCLSYPGLSLFSLQITYKILYLTIARFLSIFLSQTLGQSGLMFYLNSGISTLFF